MSEAQRLLSHYGNAVRFPEVSGFEVLEMLDVRSRLARRETDLTSAEQARLEKADTVFLEHTPDFFDRVDAIGNLSELRRRASAPCSHWWWYLEKLAGLELAAAQ